MQAVPDPCQNPSHPHVAWVGPSCSDERALDLRPAPEPTGWRAWAAMLADLTWAFLYGVKNVRRALWDNAVTWCLVLATAVWCSYWGTATFYLVQDRMAP